MMVGGYINFSEMCKNVAPKPERGKMSEGEFVVKMLESCGCHYFTKDDYHDNPKKMFEGTRRFSKHYRAMCNNVNVKNISKFFSSFIVERKNEVAVARRFYIPKADKVDVKILSKALAYQLRAFVENTEKEDIVHNIVAEVYKKTKPGLGKFIPEDEVVAMPLYPHDNYELISGREYACRCYQKMEYIIKIRNCGSVKWDERRLVLVGEPRKGVILSTKEFTVLDTRPGQDADFHIVIQHRNEGIYKYKWLMLNYDGDDCFPNRPDDISFTVDVSYQEEEEGKS